MFKQKTLVVAITLSTLALTACNSNDDDNVGAPSTTTTITVTPSLGKILNGRIALKNAKTGASLAPTQTITPSSNGTATFTVPVSKIAEPVLAEVLPTTSGVVEYFDEALEDNKKITVAAADIAKPILRAAASVTANANIGVTGLTEAAVQQAEKQVGGLITQNINSANEAVKNALKLNFDVTQAPVVVGKGEFAKLINASISNALEAQRKAYATYLATLAKEAQRINSTSSTPAYDMARAFANDFAHDGAFNAIGSQTLAINYTNTFLTHWLNWVQNFYASFLNLQTIVDFNRWYGGFNIANKESVKAYPDAVPIRTVDGVEEYACSGEGRIKSSQSDGISMDFVNQRGSNMSIYWLNYQAQRVSYKQNLPTGQTHVQDTFVTHPWLITDNTGTCIGIYRPVTKTNKTLTFKSNEVLLGNGNSQATSCTTGVETTFATTATNAPFTNGQKVCFDATTTTLAFNSKTLTNPVKNTVVQAPYSAYAFKDGSYSYEVIFNNNALYEINLSLTSFLGQFTPVVTVPTIATCASKNLPVATLSSLADYNGDYKDAGTVVFNLNTSTAKASVKGTEANIKEVCGPNNQSNGTNHVVITDKGEVTLFKTTTNVYSAEGKEFADNTKVFYGEKATAITNTCSSTGADNKLGFTNAPSDFCGFTTNISSISPIPNLARELYIFDSANGETVTITVGQNTVIGVSVQKGGKYGFACGTGIATQCQNIVFNNQSTFKEFSFTNTMLQGITGTTQNLTLKNGSLIHQINNSPSNTAVTVNTDKCTLAQSQTIAGITGNAYISCASDSVGDFTLTAQDNNTASPTHDGIPCSLSKVGSEVTITKGAKSLSVLFNGNITDALTVRTGNIQDSMIEKEIMARTDVGAPSEAIYIRIRKDGSISSAQAQKAATDESFGCVAL